MIAQSWSQSVLQSLALSIKMHAGLSFVPATYDELERRTRRAMAKANVSDLGDYADGLGSGRFSFDDWVDELTVGETYFFREPRHFEFLRKRALPGLMALRGPRHVFRLWSAGCASGEEAYSLAIVFEEQCLSASLHLVATDVSRAALAKARQGRYGAWSLRGAADDFIDRYFRRREGKQFEIAERLRLQVSFEQLNLALDEYPSLLTGVWGNDVIFCRNVMIYLDRDVVRNVARRLFESLADGGWLITGPSDPPLGDYAPYETIVTDAGVFYRRPHVRAAVTSGATKDGDRRPPEREAEDEITSARSNAAFSQLSSSRDALPAPPVANRDSSLPATVAAKESSAACDGESEPAPLLRAQAALAKGHYERAIEVARTLTGDARAAALEVRAVANLLGTSEASRLCSAAVHRFPLASELHVLHASLLLDLREYERAAESARRLLYLDRSLVVGHLLLGSALRMLDERAEAARAFRNACELTQLGLADDVVPFAEGEKAGRLADFARAQLRLLAAAARGERKG